SRSRQPPDAACGRSAAATLSQPQSHSPKTAALPMRPGSPSTGPTSMATRTLTETAETILRSGDNQISLLVADEGLSLTYATRAAGERVPEPHVPQHTEAFYVLEGELTFEVGAERETITLGAGGFVAAPPGVAHAYLTAGDKRARWLVIHARDGGFA